MSKIISDLYNEMKNYSMHDFDKLMKNAKNIEERELIRAIKNYFLQLRQTKLLLERDKTQI